MHLHRVLVRLLLQGQHPRMFLSMLVHTVTSTLSMLEGEAKVRSTLSSSVADNLMVPSTLSIYKVKVHLTLRARVAMKGVAAHLVAQRGESKGVIEVLGEGVAGAAIIKVHNHIVLLFTTLLALLIPIPNSTGAKVLRSFTKCSPRATDLQCTEGLRGPLSQQCLLVLGLCNLEGGALRMRGHHMDLAVVLLCKFLRRLLQAMGQVLVESWSSLAQWL